MKPLKTINFLTTKKIQKHFQTLIPTIEKIKTVPITFSNHLYNYKNIRMVRIDNKPDYRLPSSSIKCDKGLLVLQQQYKNQKLFVSTFSITLLKQSLYLYILKNILNNDFNKGIPGIILSSTTLTKNLETSGQYNALLVNFLGRIYIIPKDILCLQPKTLDRLLYKKQLFDKYLFKQILYFLIQKKPNLPLFKINLLRKI